MTDHLKGFTNPLSPNGTASTVSPTPHAISADAIRVIFRAGDDVARRYLPRELDPVDGGRGYAYVADMLKISSSEPNMAFDSPQRTQYGEAIIGFFCTYRGRPGRYSAFIWVDQDWSMMFGAVMGWPKKIGTIHRTHINPFNPMMRAIGPGTSLSGSVHRLGAPIFQIGVGIERSEQKSGTSPRNSQNTAYLLRHFPSVGPNIPQVRQLVALHLADLVVGDVFIGKPSLEIGHADNEDLDLLRNVELISGEAYKAGWMTDTSLELLHTFDS